MQYTTFKNEGRMPVPSEESKVGYADVYATPEYFYAKFSEDRCLDNPYALCKEVHVFDHSGNPQYKIIFPNPISAFAVSENNKYIYVAEADQSTERDNVIKYVLDLD